MHTLRHTHAHTHTHTHSHTHTHTHVPRVLKHTHTHAHTHAGAIGSFYWAGGDSALMPRFPVLTSLKNTSIYHMGSIAFGSFIMAVIQFIR